MPKNQERFRKALKPFLASGSPNEKGEWDLHCPLPSHEDKKDSASVNFDKEVWFCHACKVGGQLSELMAMLTGPFEAGVALEAANGNGSKPKPLPSEGSVHGWHSALMSNRDALRYLEQARGLYRDILVEFQIGLDKSVGAFTIPVRDADGNLVNVRWYDPAPDDSRRKIWGAPGHNAPYLYPVNQLDNDEIIVCEGEWDALATIQEGLPAITRTSSAKTWNSAWNELFSGKLVFVCHDRDAAGQSANRKVYLELRDKADGILIVDLPYPLEAKHGKDLTDFWLEGNSSEDFLNIAKSGVEVAPEKTTLKDLSVLDSFSSDNVGSPMRMRVTIVGKRTPPFLLPEQIEYRCTQDAGVKCGVCPMNDLGGSADRTIHADNPLNMELMGSTKQQVGDLLRKFVGAQKCTQLRTEIVKSRSVEELSVRPSVELARVRSGESGDYTSRAIISVGTHDTMPNNTVEIEGAIHPNPRSQHNEFLAWEVNRTETSIDRFHVDENVINACSVFQPAPKQSPFSKLADIAKDLSTHVTKIYGRNEMHAAMDLVWHSALQFPFAGEIMHRGWLELLIVGDTRTGKSEAAQKLLEYYDAGEMVSCESVTFAGVVGGLQQVGTNKQWEVTWGVVPLNDRRLVVLDEIGGMTTEQIAQMSSIRSSGEAQLTKIRSERTWARTRLIWQGNPRNHRMADYTYGVQAIAGLIGNNEDIARFDLAMTVSADEVDSLQINRSYRDEFPARHGREASRLLVQWAWSRRAEHVIWSPGAEEEVYTLAVKMGKRYVESPPLIQVANVRVKIARVAVALAIRLFSTDQDGEVVIVTKRHVRDAVRFMDHLYSMRNFGYRDLSAERIKEVKEGSKFYDEAKQYLYNNPELAKFLRVMEGHFRTQDLQDMLNLTKEMANAIVNTLWRFRMITRQGPNIVVQPLLHEILREVR